jgi:hypothetical protein
MERQWREERRMGGTEGRDEGCDSVAGLLDEIVAGFAWKACEKEERDRTAVIVNERKRKKEGTVSSRMTEENTAKATTFKLARPFRCNAPAAMKALAADSWQHLQLYSG